MVVTRVISVTGSLSSNGTTFNNNWERVTSRLARRGPSVGRTTRTTRLCTCRTPTWRHWRATRALDLIGINAGTLPGGTLTLNPIGNSTSFSFEFPNGFTVANGATLAVGANVAVVVSSSQKLTDAGTRELLQR